eukprot:SM000022S07250  [mRNA]  locus=s22:826405:827788:+ [translate_table: standard]
MAAVTAPGTPACTASHRRARRLAAAFVGKPAAVPTRALRPAATLSSGGGAGSSGGGGGGGAVVREVLERAGRTKLDERPDSRFYASPRFVGAQRRRLCQRRCWPDAARPSPAAHDGGHGGGGGGGGRLTALYAERVPDGSDVLDFMSSWVSHLPERAAYRSVTGHGLSAAELARNPRLGRSIVQDLNKDPQLREVADCSIDAALCAVSVQYLQQPEAVFAEVYRTLRPGGVFIAIAAWRDSTAFGRVLLVKQYFQCVRGFTEPEVVQHLPSEAPSSSATSNGLLRLLQELLRRSSPADPFYAVIAYRNFKPAAVTTRFQRQQ